MLSRVRHCAKFVEVNFGLFSLCIFFTLSVSVRLTKGKIFCGYKENIEERIVCFDYIEKQWNLFTAFHKGLTLKSFPKGKMATYDPEYSTVDDFGSAFSEKNIRMGFIRKVYGILMVQLAITVAFICLFIYEENVKLYSQLHPEMLIVAFVLSFVLLIAMACFDNVRRTSPTNFICLFVFTFFESFLLGSCASFYNANEVMWAIGICAIVCLGLTLFAFQTKWDFTMCGGMLFVAVIILICFGFLCIFLPAARLVYACFGALIFSLYLVYDTQLLIGGKHKYSISPEEYIFAALNLYLDIINLFLYLLQIIGNRN